MTSHATATETLPRVIRELLDSRLGSWTCESLRGDASTRQYLRATGENGETEIVSYYPPEVRTQLARFLAAHEILASRVPVPEVLATCSCGVILRDVGDTSLSSILREDAVRGRELFRDAVDELRNLQSCELPASVPNPPFDAKFFHGEMEMTNEFYVGELMGRAEAKLSEAFGTIAENLASHPYILCHRDYHGDNLQVQGDQLWILDFQDMRLGPDTYDLASLLRDRGVVRFLGKEVEEDLLRYYARRTSAGDDLPYRYWEALLQRTIKIIGTFARQAVERGRTHYLDYIPSALETFVECIDHLPAYRTMLDSFPIDFEIRGEAS